MIKLKKQNNFSKVYKIQKSKFFFKIFIIFRRGSWLAEIYFMNKLGEDISGKILDYFSKFGDKGVFFSDVSGFLNHPINTDQWKKLIEGVCIQFKI